MQKKDIMLKEYLADNTHFCDFINGILFEGRKVLLPDAVEDLPTELIFTKENKDLKDTEAVKTIHRFRDLTKKCRMEGQEVILAIQNQSKVDFGMPVRIMTEDALDYHAQARGKNGKWIRKGDRLIPVLTLVFYHGAGSWTAMRNVSELIKIPKKIRHLKQFFQYNPLMVITPWNTEVDFLSGGWKEIFEILRWQNDETGMRTYLQENSERYQKLPDDTNRLIFALVGHLEYYEKMKEKGCEAVLCKAFEDHYNSGKREGQRVGRTKGRREGRRQGFAYGIFTMIHTSLEAGDTDNLILENIQKYFSLEEKEAAEYMKKYETYGYKNVKLG